MSAFLGSLAFIPHPSITKPQQLSCSKVPHPSSSQQPNTSQGLPPQTPQQVLPQQKPKPAASVETTDWIASTLTRRFGLGAGLAWVTFLAVGVVSEQIKTRLEVSQEEANTRNVEKEEEVVLPNGIRYYDLRVGGGASPRRGDLVVLDLQGRVQGSNSEAFVDTLGEGNKPLALVMGSRPYTKGLCDGIEYVLGSMRAGGKRKVVIPPSLGFGDEGVDLGSGSKIPPAATLEYIVQVDKVSVAPS